MNALVREECPINFMVADLTPSPGRGEQTTEPSAYPCIPRTSHKGGILMVYMQGKTLQEVEKVISTRSRSTHSYTLNS